MSRVEKRSDVVKAEEELKKTKQNKKLKQQEELANIPKSVKVISAIIVGVVFLFILIGVFTPSDENKDQDTAQANETTQTTQEPVEEEPEPKTDQEIMFDKVIGLMDSKEAFDTGSYVKGDIPTGEYAFVPFDGSGQYYSEEDTAGNIIDNENFDSFGYVHVQGAGNIKTDGVLIKTEAFEKLDAKSAKEIYEKLNNVSDYKESAMYKVGTDIAPGTYTIESYGEAYVSVMSGPVGNSDIVDNEIFKGKYSVTVSAGQYLKVSRGKIL